LPDYFIDVEEIEEDLRDSATKLFVSKSSGLIQGFLAYKILSSNKAELTWMATRSDTQSKGIGSDLMKVFLNTLKESGVETVEVITIASTDPFPPYQATRRFYQKFGFREVRIDKDHYGPGSDRGIMQLVL
jgi:ribosomal protein S18 acetylase RimI-like enzyme